MSHSQFRRVKTYTETCMDESLRQAYDYWQDQPGSTRRRAAPKHCRHLATEKFSIVVNFTTPKRGKAKIRLRNWTSLRVHTLSVSLWKSEQRYCTHRLRGCMPLLTRNTIRALIGYAKRTSTCLHTAVAELNPPAMPACTFAQCLRRASRHLSS